VPNVPPTPLLAPRKFLKAFTSARISAGLAPDASNTSGSAARVKVGKDIIKTAITHAKYFIDRSLL
jgi:hypothetical protein